MSWKDKTNYFANSGLYDDGMVITSSEEGKSASTVQGRNSKGDVVAEEMYGETYAPSCSYVLKKNITIEDATLGKAFAYDDKCFVMNNMSISTSAGTPPTISMSGEQVDDTATTDHTDCYYDVDGFALEVCHHAQELFGIENCYTLGAGVHLTDASYTIECGLTKAEKNGETVAYDIADGRITASLTFVQTSTAEPTLGTSSNGWIVSSPLSKSENDAAYPTWTVSFVKNLTHHSEG